MSAPFVHQSSTRVRIRADTQPRTCVDTQADTGEYSVVRA